MVSNNILYASNVFLGTGKTKLVNEAFRTSPESMRTSRTSMTHSASSTTLYSSNVDVELRGTPTPLDGESIYGDRILSPAMLLSSQIKK